jgi:hypothetical protein
VRDPSVRVVRRDQLSDDTTVWVVNCSDPDPIVVNLPELEEFAEPAARKYPHP